MMEFEVFKFIFAIKDPELIREVNKPHPRNGLHLYQGELNTHAPIIVYHMLENHGHHDFFFYKLSSLSLKHYAIALVVTKRNYLSLLPPLSHFKYGQARLE